MKAEIQQLLEYKSGSPDLPDYRPLPGAPPGMNVYRFGCLNCEHIFIESDPNKSLQFYWQDLSESQRKSILVRLGYKPDTRFGQLLTGPFPKEPWAYKHGYVDSLPNLALNADAAATN